jgi:hypothetical protein
MSNEAKERTEFRIVGERHGGERWEGTPSISSLGSTRRNARELARRNSVVRIQKRTVTTTPWEDVPDA